VAGSDSGGGSSMRLGGLKDLHTAEVAHSVQSSLHCSTTLGVRANIVRSAFLGIAS